MAVNLSKEHNTGTVGDLLAGPCSSSSQSVHVTMATSIPTGNNCKTIIQPDGNKTYPKSTTTAHSLLIDIFLSFSGWLSIDLSVGCHVINPPVRNEALYVENEFKFSTA